MRLFSAIITTALIAATSLTMMQWAKAADLQIVSGGAFKQVLTPLAAQYEKETGKKLNVTYQTVGQHLASIRDGKEEFDVAVLTPDAIDMLIQEHKIAPGTRTDLAKTGVGVVVKTGAPLPDISSVEAFKRSLLAAKSVAFIDPQAGGSSGIYVERLLRQLGIADQVNAKAVLVHGGSVADHIADGEAALGIHQISEILPVAETTLVGPLPAEIQNYTTYSAGIGTQAKDVAAAQALIKFLSGSQALSLIKAKGMEPIASP